MRRNNLAIKLLCRQRRCRGGDRGDRRIFASYPIEAIPRRGDGFTQKDFALHNASWLISDIVSERTAGEGRREGFQAPVACDTPIATEVVAVDDPGAMACEVKRIARFFGADLCGITDFDKPWLYTSRVDTRDMSWVPHDLPDGITSGIVLSH